MRALGPITAGLVASAAVITGPAFAAGPVYNYLEASFLTVSPDDEAVAPERDGYQIRLSSPLEPGHFLRAHYSSSKDDANTARQSSYGGALGYSSSYSPETDLYLMVGYNEHKIAGEKEKAYTGEIGFRSMLSQRLELTAGGQYLKLDKSGEEISWFGGLALEFAAGLALVGQYEVGDEETRMTVGLRLLPGLGQ